MHLLCQMSTADIVAACAVVLVQGMSIVEQLDVAATDTAVPSQSAQESGVTIEVKLKHVHDFMSNYMPNTSVEE